MSGTINPLDFPEQWDVIRLGQTVSPGMCKIGDFKQKPEFDVKKGKGVFGATITYVGRQPSRGSITFYLWTQDHFTAWDAFRPLFKYDPTKKAVQAIDIYHPALNDIDLNSVVCEGIGAVTHEGQQLYSITVDLLEYFPPPKGSAISTPTGSQSNKSSGSNSTGSGDPVADAQQAEIKRLMAQAAQP